VNVASLTGQIICGAGKVLQTPRGAIYFALFCDSEYGRKREK
jgi:hypothetical protein